MCMESYQELLRVCPESWTMESHFLRSLLTTPKQPVFKGTSLSPYPSPSYTLLPSAPNPALSTKAGAIVRTNKFTPDFG